MIGRIVCFSGKIGSGKSSVSEAVANALACKMASFGGYIRHKVESQGGDPTSRKALQDYGQLRVEQNIAEFCDDVLSYSGFTTGDDLVVDGIRHVDVYDALVRRLPNSRFHLIHLDLDDRSRKSRMAGRGDDFSDFVRAEGHVVEKDLSSNLPSRAHLVIDASAPIEDIVGNILVYLAS